MADKHLNLFYSYNQDNELIENNLTRAFIVSLRVVSAIVRNYFLKVLLEKEFIRLKINDIVDLSSFMNAKFSLQAHMSKEKVKKFAHSYIMTLASDTYVESEEAQTNGTTIPDAWIYDEIAGYCFLIEAKVGQNPLDNCQLHSHAKEWLLLMSREEVHKHLITITWIDVLQAINRVQSQTDLGKLTLNKQEYFIFDALKEYLSFFNYKLFQGFQFKPLLNPPKLKYFHIKASYDRSYLPDYADLQNAPKFQITI
jgi:hypothetical protein